jgi:HPt (histidine-containing phosphotransfer) domain-containing protein
MSRWLPDPPHAVAPTSGAASAESSASCSPASIQGFDMRRLDEIVDGDQDVLRGLLRSFHDDNAGAANAMATCLATQSKEDALRMAHTIRGSAANLGANRLSRSAQALEQLLRAGAAVEALQPALRDLDTELAAALDGAEAYLARSVTADTRAPEIVPDKAAALALCKSLSNTVRDHELIPPARLAALKAALNGCATAATQRLEASLSRYDFVTAQKALAAIELEIQ